MPQISLPLNILVVAPRPAQVRSALSYDALEGFYEGIEAQGAQVLTEHLSPVTYDALVERLNDTLDATVDIVLMDGSLGEADSETGLLMANDDESESVGAAALAPLLTKAGVSLVIAHLSEPQKGAAQGFCEELSEQTGLPVICMVSGLTRSSGYKIMSEFLAALLAGQSLATAIDNANHATDSDAMLHLSSSEPEQVLFAEADAESGVSKIVPFPGRDLGSAVDQLPSAGEPGSLPAEPSYGWVGRSREIVELEMLLADEQPECLWLTGYDGVGKTALLSHVARWLVRRGAFERVVYTRLGGSGMLDAALYDLGQCLLGQEFRLTPDAMDEIKAALAQTSTLVIWDDVQQALPGGELAMDQETLGGWYQLANQISAVAPSRLCIISDGASLPESARRLGPIREYALTDMEEAEARRLFGVLSRWREVSEPDEAAMASLLNMLGGHPLTLRIIAAQLNGRSLQAVIDGLLDAFPALSSGEARFRNQALEIAFDQFAETWDEPLREQLPALGYFAAGFIQNLGTEIMGLSADEWESAVESLITAGLVQDVPLPNLTIPLVALHPALQRLARQRLNQPYRQELRTPYYNHYFGFLSWVAQVRERMIETASRLVYADIGNMRLGLERVLEEEELTLAINYVRIYSHFLQELGFQHELTRATKSVQEATRAATPKQGPLGRPGVQLMLNQAEQLLNASQINQATGLLQQLVKRMDSPGGLGYTGRPATLDRAQATYLLGRGLRMARRVDLAPGLFQRALTLLEPLGGYEGAVEIRARIHGELSEVLVVMSNLDEAQESCEKGLEAARTLGDPRTEGTFLARMGSIAMRRDEEQEAQEYLDQALDRMGVAEDSAGLAAVEDQLALLAMRPPQDLDQAQVHLMRALEHARRGEHWMLEGQILTQIAQVATQSQALDQAKEHLQQAAALYESHNAPTGIISTRASLAELYLQEGRVEEAQAEAQAALQAGEGDGSAQVPWELYLLLERIAKARDDAQEASRWRAEAQDTFAQSPQARTTLLRWKPVIDAVVKSAKGEAMDTEAAQTLEEMEQSEEWKALGQSIWQILSGERDERLYRELDHVDSLIVRRILDILADEDTETDD